MKQFQNWLSTQFELPIQQETLQRTLRDNGISSMGTFRILAHLEDEYDIVLEEGELEIFLKGTLNSILLLAEKKAARAQS